MHRVRFLLPAWLVLSAASAGAQPTVSTRAYAAAMTRFVDGLRATPNAPPGTVVVVTLRGETLFARASGYRNLATGARMTLDTPVYNASLTKSYTGLLAAMLDADGTLPLSTSLADIWPNLRLPGALDPRTIRTPQLLSHSMPFDADALQYRSYVTGEGLSPPEVAEHLAAHATPREPVFRYANTGPVVWAAMMQARTGVHWRDMLRRRVLQPLGMRRSSARAEDFPQGELALCHARWAGSWRPAAPKPEIVMSAAGGMFTSARDTARFVKMFATDGASERGRISAKTLRRTWMREIGQKRLFLGMERDGYGLGWDLGTFAGHEAVARGGTYTGCRSAIMFLPKSGLGVVVLSNGDAAGHLHNEMILAQAVDLFHDRAGAHARGAKRVADYHESAARAIARTDESASRLAEARPADAPLAASIAGRYVSDRAGTFQVIASGGELQIRHGVASGRLLWLGGDTLLAVVDPEPRPEPLKVERDAAGLVIALTLEGQRFTRRTA
jgi:CubicO group peptidase (beta-lactamase class C family)